MIAKTDSSSIQTELYQTITKMNQISKKHHILDSLMEVRASSHTHCQSVMNGCYEKAEPMGNTVSLFSAIMEQRKQVWQIMAAFESTKQLHAFFNMDSLVKQLFATEGPGNTKSDLIFAGQGVDPTLDRIDRVALSVAVKESLFQKLLSHNQGILEDRKRYKDNTKN